MPVQTLALRSRSQSDHYNDGDEATNRLLRLAAHAPEPERQRLIDEVVVLNLRLAELIANRYSGRGIESEDLVQVASLGLVNAAHRFDPELGEAFVSFAMPTIAGEVKRYFRDHAWTVRPPRRVQELYGAISNVSSQITQSLGASPSPSDIASYLGVNVDDVLEATASHECFTGVSASIDDRGRNGDVTPLADALGSHDKGFDRVEAVVALAPVCRRLGPRDRRILFLRFFRGWTQQEIASELGLTQMQVSRLLTRIFSDLRRDLGVAEPAERQPGRPR